MTSLTLTLRDMAYGGDAVGVHQGKAVFVPLALPGETVRVEVVEDRKRMARARLLEVLEPSPDRVLPPCRHFGVCGGCQWQHARYPAQLTYKQAIVTSQLERIGHVVSPPVRPMIGMTEPWSYRNHVQLSLGFDGSLGYLALKSHEVVEVEECWITHPLLDELWAALDVELEGLERISLRAGVATGEQMIVFEGDTLPEVELDLPVSCAFLLPDGEPVVLAGDDHYHEALRGRRFRVSAPSFFQVNTLQAERLLDVVQGYLELGPSDVLLDAYSGVGAFALSLAGQAGRVIGIESEGTSIRDALMNVRDDEPVEFVAGPVEEVLPELDVRLDAAVLDPPRAGCAPGVPEALAKAGTMRIAYVSCDPSSLARDVARFAELGYRLVEVQPVDLFPQTYHIECVVLMARVEK